MLVRASCVRACARVRVRACVRACVRVCALGGTRWHAAAKMHASSYGLALTLSVTLTLTLTLTLTDGLRIPCSGEGADTVPLLVFAHKADLPTSLGAAGVSDALGLARRPHALTETLSSTGNSGQNLYEGLDWLSQKLTGDATRR
jgi:hypothetical protein